MFWTDVRLLTSLAPDHWAQPPWHDVHLYKSVLGFERSVSKHRVTGGRITHSEFFYTVLNTCHQIKVIRWLTVLRKHGALRPQKPLRLIRDGEVGGMGISPNTYSLNCHHQNDSALRWAAVWVISMFHYLLGQSHKTVSINHNFWRERRTEADRTEVLLLTSLAPYR